MGFAPSHRLDQEQYDGVIGRCPQQERNDYFEDRGSHGLGMRIAYFVLMGFLSIFCSSMVKQCDLTWWTTGLERQPVYSC